MKFWLQTFHSFFFWACQLQFSCMIRAPGVQRSRKQLLKGGCLQKLNSKTRVSWAGMLSNKLNLNLEVLKVLGFYCFGNPPSVFYVLLFNNLKIFEVLCKKDDYAYCYTFIKYYCLHHVMLQLRSLYFYFTSFNWKIIQLLNLFHFVCYKAPCFSCNSLVATSLWRSLVIPYTKYIECLGMYRLWNFFEDKFFLWNMFPFW